MKPYWLRVSLLGLFLATLFSNVARSAAQESTTTRQEFAQPASKFRPLVRWWWPGNDVTDAELRREVNVLDEGGFGGAEIQPFNIGLASHHLPAAELTKVNDYASPSFFRHVATALEQAKARGLFVDYTFGSGWPFGGPWITPELASIELRSSRISVAGPVHFHSRLQLPLATDGRPGTEGDAYKGLPAGWAERLEARTRTVAVVALRGGSGTADKNQVPNRELAVFNSGQLLDGSAVDLTGKMAADGTLDWDIPEGTWQIFVFRSVPTLHKLLGGVGQGAQLEMDHFSSAAFATHAENVGDRAVPYLSSYFGNTLRAIFCDSLEVKANLYWSDDLLAEFRKRHGYDLLPYLPLLKVQGYGNPFGEYESLPAFDIPGKGDQVRRDYRQTVSDLMRERFFNPFNAWAHAHGLLARTQSHGAPADILRIYGEADIPETEDLYDEGRYDFLKMAGSGAHLYGRSVVGSESFVWRTQVYQTTPEKMKVAADELLTAGVNAILYHGFPYIVPNLPAPGWHPFAGTAPGNSHSSQFNELNTLWPFFAQLNAYITRVQYLSQTSTNVADIALFREELAHAATESPKPSPPLAEALMNSGYNYDHMNADALRRSHVENGTLIAPGTGRYRVLIFDHLSAMPPDIANLLLGFAQHGLRIVFEGRIPQVADSLSVGADANTALPHAIAALHASKSVSSVADDDALMTTVQQHATPDVRFAGAALRFIHLRKEGLDAYFLRNPSDAPVALDAAFNARTRPELWDPWTGKISAIPIAERKGEGTRVHLDIAAFGSALIVFDRSAPADRRLDPIPGESHVTSVQEISQTGWELQATGMRGVQQVDLSRHLSTLFDWSFDPELRTFAGHAAYTTSFDVTPAQMVSGTLWLDLGNVRDVAQVAINEQPVGTLLLRPYRVDVTKYVHPGTNKLRVTVTNALFNAMITRTPRLFSPGHTENASGFMSGGLLGPVRIEVRSPTGR